MLAERQEAGFTCIRGPIDPGEVGASGGPTGRPAAGGPGLKVETRESRGSRRAWAGEDGVQMVFGGEILEALGTGLDGCPSKVPAKVSRRAGLW